jgi:N-acetylglucosamine-6-phosphate deacetylase
VTVEVIADGVHLHPDVVKAVITAAGADRVAMITDAIAAAGRSDGAFRLGAVPIDVAAGVARVHGTSRIAGSTATMDRLFRTVHAGAGLAAAVQTTAATPARALGLQGVGVLHTGYDANLVVLNQRLGISDVMVRGAWRGNPSDVC